MLFNKLLKITPHNTQKKNKKKRKNSPARQAFEREGKGRNVKRKTQNAKREGRARREGRYIHDDIRGGLPIRFQSPPDRA